METYQDLPVLTFKTLEQWMDWLDKHHTQTTGIWLKFAKKGTGVTTIGYTEAREGALIYGWIDGQANRLDDTYYLQRMTPRRPRSKWSEINVKLVEGYIKEGRMKPAGMAQVEAAKADGRWDAAYPGQSTITVPDDFQKALDANPKAQEFFDGLGKSARFLFLYRIQDAKRPETRERRIKTYTAMLEKGEKRL